MPVAMNCSSVPLAIDGFVGVTSIDTSAAGDTVNTVVAVLPPKAAETLTVPWRRPDARPATETDATVESELLHVTEVVIFCVELSLKVPVAVSCLSVPLATEGFVGVI